ncbi:MAG: PKD domain-containing protein [Cyclobacteriaceae bacterium]
MKRLYKLLFAGLYVISFSLSAQTVYTVPVGPMLTADNNPIIVSVVKRGTSAINTTAIDFDSFPPGTGLTTNTLVQLYGTNTAGLQDFFGTPYAVTDYWTIGELSIPLLSGGTVQTAEDSRCGTNLSIARWRSGPTGNVFRYEINETTLGTNWDCFPYKRRISVGRVVTRICNSGIWNFGPTCTGTPNTYSKEIYIDVYNPFTTLLPNPSFGNVCIGATPQITVGTSPDENGIGVYLNLVSDRGSFITEQSCTTGCYTLNSAGHGAGQINISKQWNFSGFANGAVSVNLPFVAAGSVLSLPVVSAGTNETFCKDTGDVSLSGASPGGGTWSGSPYVSSNGTFSTNPSTVGNHIVTYSFTDGNGCTNSINKTVIITALPIVGAGSDQSSCRNSGNLNLTGVSPTGGVWSGSTYLVGNQFDTSAPAGNYTLTYTYTNPTTTCQNTDDKVVTILALPVVSAGSDFTVCNLGGNVALSGASPAGGSWSGTGVTGSTLNPLIGGLGPRTLTYTYNDGSCANTSNLTVTVLASPTVSAGANSSVCISSGLLNLTTGSPSGGIWTGTAVTGNQFDPAIGAGTYVLTYTYTDPITSCVASANRSITVNPLPVVEAGNNLPNVCVSQANFTLLGFSPSGGVWSGTGLSGPTQFSPATAGVGVHVLTYTFTNATTNCSNSDIISITVNAGTTVNIGSDQTFCSTSPVYNLNSDLGPSELGGVWSGTGVSGVNFNPANVGTGTYVITYTFTNANGCISTQQKQFTVVTGPAVNAGNTLEVCISNGVVNLVGETPLGGVYSGLGVVGNTFDPLITGTGVYTVTYTYTTAFCTSSATRQITVNAATPVSAGPNLTVCVNATDFLLTGASVNGGVWNGNGVAGGFFSPSAAGVGTHIITYTYTNNKGCISTSTRNINVNAAPVVDAGTDITLCSNSGIYSLIANASPSGGTFSGPGVQLLNFNPTLAGVGVHQINYSYTDPITNCSRSDFRFITVIAPSSTVTIGANISVCVTAAPIALTGESIPGGVYSGVGVSGNTFSPVSAGVGVFTITYTVPDASGCSATATRQISVIALPAVSAGPDIFVCSGAPLVALNGTGNPVGGTFSGPFVSGNNFNVGASGPGTFQVTYTYTNATGCTNTAIKNIIVDSGAIVNAGPDFAVCVGSPVVDLASRVSPGGGSFTGAGVSGTNFNPSIGLGSYTITYTLSNTFGCAGTDTFVVTVNPLPSVNAGSTRSFCLNEPNYDLASTAVPAGGSFFGPGVSGNLFTPSSAGVGTHTIFYTYTNVNGCSNTATRTLTVTDLPVVNAGGSLFMCINGPLIDLSIGATPVNGTWSGSGIIPGTPIFNPQLSGVGTFLAQYTIVQSNGCSNFNTKVITVFPQLTVDAGPDISVCSNAPIVNLNIGASPTGGTWSGTSVTGTNFNPSVGPGSYLVNYSYTDFYGCAATDTKTITVIPPGAVSVGSDLTVCVTASPIDLAASIFPTGGTFFGTGLQGTNFNPALAGIGVHGISYTVTDGSGCTNTKIRTITVTAPPVVDAGPNRVICISSGLVDLDQGSSVTGGVWTGTAVSGSFFNPPVAGLGTFVINYLYNNGAGCISTDTKTLTVRPDATVDAGVDVTVCVNQVPIDFTTSPDKRGGVWNGIGMSGNIFSPSVAGAGNYTINYTYTDAFGCAATDTKNVRVNPLPPVSAGSPLSLCTTAPAVNLNGAVFPSGGTWSGVGLTGSFFNPQTTGSGVYTVSYSVTDANGCTNSATKQITVTLPPVINLGGNQTVCIGSNIIDLNLVSGVSGGVWSGTGTSNGQFDPSFAGVGNHLQTYTFNNGLGCISTGTKTMVVRANPTVNAGPDINLCVNATPYNLSTQTTPSGGVWSGIGIASNTTNFSPSVAGLGAQVLKYTYTDTYGCVVSDNIIASVKAIPVVDAGPNLSICTTAPPLNLNLTSFPSTGIWTGPSISGNNFNPAVGVGSYNLIYTLTNSDGCVASDSRTLAVTLPPSVNIGANRILCVNSARIDLDLGVTPIGGSWSGSSGLEGSFFNPALAGVGTYQVTYTYNSGQGCISTATKTIQVRTAITVTAGLNRNFCRNSPTYNMTNDPSLLGGSWSGTGVSGNNFNPNTAGVGIHIITYTYADEFGCVATAQRAFTVSDVVAVSAGPAVTICVTSGPLSLAPSGFPAGGNWSGQGIVSNTFNPATVGAGIYQVTYAYGDANGCTGTATKQITVTNPPVVEAGANFDICINAAPISLNGATPINGAWSGLGVIAGVFDPLSAGLGLHVLTYTYTNANSCTSSDVINVNVLSEPLLTIGGDKSVCIGDTPMNLLIDASLKGGTFTGPGITGSIFNPSTAKAGTHVITYTLRYNGCDLTAFRNITVNTAQALLIGENKALCLDANNYDLIKDVNVIGGTWSGNGLSGSIFRPSIAGVGSHVLTYTYVNAFGCSSSAFRVFTIQDQLPINAGDDLTICSAVGNFDLTGRGSPSGGIYVGTGVTNNVFNPTASGLGVFTINYVVDNGNGCVSTDALDIEVRASSINNFGTDSIVCINTQPIPLNFSAELQGGIWSGTGVVSNTFYPSLAGVGTHILNFTISTQACDIAGRRTMTVTGLPKSATTTQSSVSGCAGSFVTLSAKINPDDLINNVTVGWFRKDASEPFAIGESIQFEIESEEQVYFKAINQFGCSSGQSDFIRVQTDNPSGNFNTPDTTVPFAKPIIFYSTSLKNAQTFEWSFGDGLISYERNPYKYYYESGTFNVSLKLTSSTGCVTTITKEKYITVLTEPGREDKTPDNSGGRIGSPSRAVIEHSPNPNKGQFQISIEATNAELYKITVTDFIGHSYEAGTFEINEGSNVVDLDISNFNPGVYNIILRTNTEIYNFKTIKQ